MSTKRCPTMRQPCPQPMQCGLGCYAQLKNFHVKNTDGSDAGLPVVMLDKPWMWLRDLVITTLYHIGVGSLILIVVGGAIGIGYGIFYR